MPGCCLGVIGQEDLEAGRPQAPQGEDGLLKGDIGRRFIMDTFRGVWGYFEILDILSLCETLSLWCICPRGRWRFGPLPGTWSPTGPLCTRPVVFVRGGGSAYLLGAEF